MYTNNENCSFPMEQQENEGEHDTNTQFLMPSCPQAAEHL